MENSTDKYLQIYARYMTYTMIPPETYVANLEIVNHFRHIPGSVVECGTWKGGMIGGIAHLLGSNREYWLFDSFAGLPPAREIDGMAALRWQADITSPAYFNNCTAMESEAVEAMNLAGIADPKIRKGWFQETLPGIQIHGGVSILRMDADWYDSTMDILIHLFSQVNQGGCIIVDDYYTWDGCAKAVHDFLSRHQCVERIRTYKNVCFLVKTREA